MKIQIEEYGKTWSIESDEDDWEFAKFLEEMAVPLFYAIWGEKVVDDRMN